MPTILGEVLEIYSRALGGVFWYTLDDEETL